MEINLPSKGLPGLNYCKKCGGIQVLFTFDLKDGSKRKLQVCSECKDAKRRQDLE